MKTFKRNGTGKSKRKKAWAQGFFREGKTKGIYHQTSKNMRVSDREDNFQVYDYLFKQ